MVNETNKIEFLDDDFISKRFIALQRDLPFFSYVALYLRRRRDDLNCPTAGVYYNEHTDDLVMMWNGAFVAGLTELELNGLIAHEIYHIIFRHILERKREPHRIWNYATDLAINSLISRYHSGTMQLPKGGLIPGQRPQVDLSNASKEEIDAINKFADIIEKFPPEQTSDWYFSQLMEKLPPETKGSGGDGDGSGADGDGAPSDSGLSAGGLGRMDTHDGWDKLTPEQKERLKNKIKAIVTQAAARANNSSNGWGSMPADLREQILMSIDQYVDWRALMKQWIGFSQPFGRAKSLKKISRKYPYIHPGVRRNRIANVLIAIDQSGSVGDENIAQAFAVLEKITKKMNVTVCHFDTEIDHDSIFTWRKGTKHPATRTKCGGTDFNAPTRFINDPKNAGRYDKLLIITDGECGAPGPCRVSRGYLIVPGRKLLFETNDFVMEMKENPCAQGSWR